MNTKRIGAIYKGILLSMMVLSYLYLTYRPHRAVWWSLLGTAIILISARLYWSAGWLKSIGLNINFVEIIYAVLFFAVTAVISYIVIEYIAFLQGISFKPYFAKINTASRYLHTFGQTLNEELILGALLLFSLRSLLKKIPIIALSMSVALLFTIFHILFYSLYVSSFDRGTLSVATTITLMLVGIARNNLILCTNHIGYSWAIHLGWNVVFLGGNFVKESGQLMNEPELFNTFFGSQIIIISSFIIVLITILIYKKEIFKAGQ